MNAQEITKALGGSWHGSYGTARCPAHDDREPSLSIRDGVDGEPIVNCFAGCDWRDIKDVLRARGLLPERGERPAWQPRRSRAPKPQPDDTDQQQRIEFVRRKWHESAPLADTPAEVYLGERGLKPGPDGWPPSLRYHLALKHGPTGLHLPTMLGAVAIWPGHEIVGLHRTFLRADGRGKAPVSGNKMMLGKCAGGAVRLAPAGPKLMIAEGIETSLSVQEATGLPTWAALSASGIAGLVLPALPLAAEVVIAADNDVNRAGMDAAEKAAALWVSQGRKVWIAQPPTPGTDFNDMVREGSCAQEGCAA